MVDGHRFGQDRVEDKVPGLGARNRHDSLGKSTISDMTWPSSQPGPQCLREYIVVADQTA